MVNFQVIADEIYSRCETLEWLVPNTKKGTNISVKPWNVSKETAQFLHMFLQSVSANNILELVTSV